ncbi:MAG: protein kinase [Candidatus Latescibacterota bacterium]|nr:MAG: protein kinase [Candidatus Latescibacterota bacterium]
MIGRTVSHYKILEKLGEGGMGVVYKAEDISLKRFVALKFLPAELTRDVEARERFIQEAQSASALDHPNICTIHEIGQTDDDQMFICMTYYEGETLSERIKGGPFPTKQAIDIALQIARGLSRAHESGIVHRDVKPANIVVTKRDEVKIVDFGLAKLAGQSKLTRAGTTVGTAAYMSPEQARAETIDHRTDIWSLGVVIYEMITGRAPFKGDHEAAVLYSIVNDEPEPLTELRAGVPAEIERVTTKALAKDPAHRYQHLGELQNDLETLKVSLVGSRAASASGAPVTHKSMRRVKLVGIPIIVAVVAVIVTGIWLNKRKSGVETPATTSSDRAGVATTPPQNSIAVLPLANLSKGDENEFFVDGMTEELITQLAQIRALKVISSTSVMRFKDTEEPLTDIAKVLNVATVLEGSVLWAGDQVRISVQLVDGLSDRYIWANSYHSDLGDVLGLQRRVARDVARQTRVELTAQEEDRLAVSPSVNEKAYELYLQGRFHWNQRSPQNLYQAMEYYKRATDIDPDYALAHAGLAESQVLLGTWAEGLRPDEVYPKAREMALRALEIDPGLAAAHAVLGLIAHEYEWKFDEAERHFRRAIELNPNYATAHQWYGELLATLGRLDECRREMQTAHELDPLSLIINSVRGEFLVLGGEVEAGLTELEKVIRLDPSFAPAYLMLGSCYWWTGDTEKAALANLNYAETSAISERQKDDARALRATYEKKGLGEYYSLAIAQKKRLHKESYASPAMIAGLYVESGEPDSAIAWLERGYREHATFMYTIPRDGRFEVLRDDPRFIDLMKRMGLTYWR